MLTSVQFIVVDDDRTSNLICKHTLRRFFKENLIAIFTEPEDALKAIEEEYIKTDKNASIVLFLDINMPSMSGWEFLEVFKNFNTHIQKQFTIYMLSSSVGCDDAEKAEKNTFVSGFISKPLTLAKLKEIFILSNTIG